MSDVEKFADSVMEMVEFKVEKAQLELLHRIIDARVDEKLSRLLELLDISPHVLQNSERGTV